MLPITPRSSIETPLDNSLVEPPRSTTARSGSPPRSRVPAKPAAMARMAIITPTTPPMPTTITDELPSLDGRLRRFINVISMICPNMALAPS